MSDPSRPLPQHRPAKTDPGVIRRYLNLLMEPGEVYELRAPGTSKRTACGYFDDPGALARDAARLSGQAPGVNVTLNPAKADLLARSANRISNHAIPATSDSDIVWRRRVLFDFDAVRSSGISATREEHEAALDRARQCCEWLIDHGVKRESMVLADSGNGGHVLLAVDLPNDEEGKRLVNRCLKTAALFLDDERVHVDQTTGNAGRIAKVYGTLAAKGDSLPERPHRTARLLEVPEGPMQAVPREILEAVAALAPTEPTLASVTGPASAAFDVPAFISRHGLDVGRTGDWNGGVKYVLRTCPFNPEHANQSAVLIQHSSGAISFTCHHNGCHGNDWKALREMLEPSRSVGCDKSDQCDQRPQLWPEPPAKEAYVGLAGEVVELLSRYTEGDKVALLSDFLAYFGNMVGHGPYAQVGADRHGVNEFFVNVGKSSRARKGGADNLVRACLEEADDSWSSQCLTSGLSTGEGVVNAVRDAVFKVDKEGAEQLVDEGVKDRRLLVREPEFSRVLTVMGREHNTLSAVLRGAWDDGNLKVMTKVSQKATGAHISIVASITCEELRRKLCDTDMVNGFANRFIWLAVRRTKELPDPQALALDPKLGRKLAEVVAWARSQGRIARDPEATKLWRSEYSRLTRDRPGLGGGILDRAEAHVLRLSVLYALLDRSPKVGVTNLTSALALWDYAERSVAYIFESRLGDPTADTIDQALQVHQQMSRTAIRDLFQRHVRDEEIERALGVLLAQGRARSEKVVTGGRPAEIWTSVASVAFVASKNPATEAQVTVGTRVTGNGHSDRVSYSDQSSPCECGTVVGLLHSDGWVSCRECGRSRVTGSVPA